MAETNNTSDVDLPLNVSVFFVAPPPNNSVHPSALQPFAALKSNQSLKYLHLQIQDFSERGANPWAGTNLLFGQFNDEKCMKMKKLDFASLAPNTPPPPEPETGMT